MSDASEDLNDISVVLEEETSDQDEEIGGEHALQPYMFEPYCTDSDREFKAVLQRTRTKWLKAILRTSADFKIPNDLFSWKYIYIHMVFMQWL